jgi:hypothetical protein
MHIPDWVIEYCLAPEIWARKWCVGVGNGLQRLENVGIPGYPSQVTYLSFDGQLIGIRAGSTLRAGLLMCTTCDEPDKRPVSSRATASMGS